MKKTHRLYNRPLRIIIIIVLLQANLDYFRWNAASYIPDPTIIARNGPSYPRASGGALPREEIVRGDVLPRSQVAQEVEPLLLLLLAAAVLGSPPRTAAAPPGAALPPPEAEPRQSGAPRARGPQRDGAPAPAEADRRPVRQPDGLAQVEQAAVDAAEIFQGEGPAAVAHHGVVAGHASVVVQDHVALVRSANHHAPDGLRARAVQHGVERQLVLGAEQALV